MSGILDTSALVAAVRAANPGLRLPGLVLLVEQLAVAGGRDTPATSGPARPPDWTPETGGTDPLAAGRARQVAETLRSGRPACDNGGNDAPTVAEGGARA